MNICLLIARKYSKQNIRKEYCVRDADSFLKICATVPNRNARPTVDKSLETDTRRIYILELPSKNHDGRENTETDCNRRE